MSQRPHHCLFTSGVFLLVLVAGACNTSPPGAKGAGGGAGAGSSGGSGGSSTGVTTGNATSCPKGALAILFSPMYSAFDGVHTFQVPAVVNGIDPTAVTVVWSASDPSMVALAPDATTGGAMITTQKAGTVSIIATAGSLCGSSLLTITAATSDDWMSGSARYNDGVVITRIPRPPRPDAGATAMDAGMAQEAACTNCHGDTAANGPFKTVQHTPEQTGGFSDDELAGIFQTGVVPMGGYFDTSIVPYNVWQTFHKWDVGDSAKGVIVYLRSLAPAAQTGAGNFGGRLDGGIPDGGFDGGFMRRDGGMDMGGRRDAQDQQ